MHSEDPYLISRQVAVPSIIPNTLALVARSLTVDAGGSAQRALFRHAGRKCVRRKVEGAGLATGMKRTVALCKIKYSKIVM